VGGARQGEGEWSSPERRGTGEGATVFSIGGGAPVVFVSDCGPGAPVKVGDGEGQDYLTGKALEVALTVEG
jgi:hypothetical protein